MKPCTRKGRRLCGPECTVHLQCAVLDKEEMLGYILGDTFGLPVIPQPYARSVGEAARLRAIKVGPAIEAAARRLSKSSGDSDAAAAAELDALRSCVVVELPLPSRRACAAGDVSEEEPEPDVKPERMQHADVQPCPMALAQAELREAQQAKWDADAQLKTATRALARLRPPPNFKGVRAEYDVRYWLAAHCSATEKARRDALREEVWAAEAEHRRAKHAARGAARALAAIEEISAPDEPLDYVPELPMPSPDPELATQREELDRQWAELKRQREEDEAFTTECEARRKARRAHVDAVREECEAYAARLARAATRRMLHADAERVWGPDWQSR